MAKRQIELGIKKKGKLHAAIIRVPYYTQPDFIDFTLICEEIGLSSLRKVIEHSQFRNELIQGYIKAISEGRTHCEGVNITESITDGQKKYHEHLYHLMFKVPLEDVPLYLDEEREFLPVIEWRLRISK